jgi:hypothetical protein
MLLPGQVENREVQGKRVAQGTRYILRLDLAVKLKELRGLHVGV